MFLDSASLDARWFKRDRLGKIMLEEIAMDGSGATATSYEADVLEWSREQAAALRKGDFARFDLEHLADEIEDVGKSEKRELASHLANLLAHLLEYHYQPTAGRAVGA